MTIKFNVLNRFDGSVQFTAEIECADSASESFKLGLAVQWAVKSRANLRGANLFGADLYEANLFGADLYEADLSKADLSEANLSEADLSRANLSRANLSRANLSRAYLSRADLSRANLSRADLSGADLSRANLSGVDLYEADLSRANLSGADLSGADLFRATGIELAIARTRILPEGDLIGWKKCKSGIIVKLLIPKDARRSHAFGRKCRAEFVDVVEVTGAEVGISQHDCKTEYRAGERVACGAWDDNWQEECSGGIHFYITREEAEAH